MKNRKMKLMAAIIMVAALLLCACGSKSADKGGTTDNSTTPTAAVTGTDSEAEGSDNGAGSEAAGPETGAEGETAGTETGSGTETGAEGETAGAETGTDSEGSDNGAGSEAAGPETGTEGETAGSETEAGAEAEAARPEQLAASVSRVLIGRVYEDTTMISKAECDVVTLFDSAQAPLLAKVLDEVFEGEIALAQSELERFTDMAKEDFEAEGSDFYGPYFYDKYISVNRADTNYFSFTQYSDSYAGGAHDYYSFWGYNYDTKTGEVLALDDILAEGAKDYKALTKAVELELENVYGITYDEIFMKPGYIYETFTQRARPFSIDYDGITFFFSPYEIAPYAAGAPTIKLTYKKYPDLFKAELAVTPEAYSANFLEGGILPFDINDDGETEYVKFTADDVDFYVELTVIDKWIDFDADSAPTYRVPLFGYDFCPELVQSAEGSRFIMLRSNGDSDIESMAMIGFEGLQPVSKSLVSGGVRNMSSEVSEKLIEKYWDRYMSCWNVNTVFDPQNCSIVERHDIFGTTFEVCDFYCNGEGEFLPLSKWHYLTSNDYHVKTIADVKAYVIDESGEKMGELITIPVGTWIGIVRGDLNGAVDCVLTPDYVPEDEYLYMDEPFSTEGADWIRFMFDEPRYDWSDYRDYIDGVPFTELFDGINFAG